MNRNAATGAIQGIPIEHLSTMGAGAFFLLLFYPVFSSMVLHKLQILDYFFMVPNAVHNVDFGKVFQSLAWKFRALEAPGYLFLLGAPTEAVAAVSAGGIDMVGKASVAANVLEGNFVRLGHLLQFILILILIGQVFGAGPAVKPADANERSIPIHF